ncbi:hypothetical protein LSTR_LSTR001140, partial [Laodelphax striatellus]
MVGRAYRSCAVRSAQGSLGRLFTYFSVTWTQTEAGHEFVKSESRFYQRRLSSPLTLNWRIADFFKVYLSGEDPFALSTRLQSINFRKYSGYYNR